MTIIVPTHIVAGNFNGVGNTTMASSFKVNQNRTLTRIGLYAQTSTTADVRVMVWDTNGVLLASSPTVTGQSLSTVPSTPLWVSLSTPINLTANTVYYVGHFISQHSTYSSANSTQHDEPTVNGLVVTMLPGGTGTRTSLTYYSTSDTGTVFPANGYTNEFPHGFDFVDNSPPTATNLSPSTFKDNRTAPAVFTWTYNDTESNAQTAYEIRYRLKDSTGAWTTNTVSSATASHSYATGTFTLGSDYEWQVRVSDAVAGYGEWSTLTYFTSGTSTWNYGPPVTTATQSGTIPAAFFSTDFEASDSLTNPVAWQNNNFFGTYTDCTIARTTTRPKTGSYSMEITWPTGAESRACSSLVTGLTVGSKYVFKADVYVPAGSPNISIDPFLQNNVVGALVTEKDQWITREVTFTAAGTDVFFAFKTAGSTAGQKLFVDNVSVKDATLTPGTYYVQVRTADAVGFGPWSASDTVLVAGPPNAPTGIEVNPARVGGNINVTWTYSDPESNPQTKYQIQYRRRS